MSLTSNSGVSISCQRQSISTLAASAFSASRPLRARKAAVSKHPRRYTVHTSCHSTGAQEEEHKAGGPVRRATCQLPLLIRASPAEVRPQPLGVGLGLCVWAAYGLTSMLSKHAATQSTVLLSQLSGHGIACRPLFVVAPRLCSRIRRFAQLWLATGGLLARGVTLTPSLRRSSRFNSQMPPSASAPAAAPRQCPAEQISIAARHAHQELERVPGTSHSTCRRRSALSSS